MDMLDHLVSRLTDAVVQAVGLFPEIIHESENTRKVITYGTNTRKSYNYRIEFHCLRAKVSHIEIYKKRPKERDSVFEHFLTVENPFNSDIDDFIKLYVHDC